MILTIEIPEALANQLRAEAEAQGEDLNNYAVAKLAQPLLSEEEDDEEPDEELIAALREGLADADAGRTLSLEELDTRIRAGLTARNMQKPTIPTGIV
jgi:predicted transcriptional regulator